MRAAEVVTAFTAGCPGGCAGTASRAAAGPGWPGIPRQQTPCTVGGRAPDMTSGGTGLHTLFEDAAAGLNLGEAEVIELRLRQGLEPGELATVLGVSRSHADQLLTRAREQLESCLGVLLVGRSGRGECGELRSLLAGWDGQLTAVVRTRVHRHIEQCATCTARRAEELRSARLRNLSPGAALAAGAAESFRLARGAPAALRARTIALAAGRGPGAAARHSAVLARAGAFGRRGFPKPTPAAWAGLAGPRGLGAARAALRSSLGSWLGSWLGSSLRSSLRSWLRSSLGPCRQDRGALSVVAVLAAAAAAACALAAGPPRLAPAASQKPPAPAPAPRSPARTPVPPRPRRASVPSDGNADSNAVRIPHNDPFTKNPRQLRSWIESDRLR